MLNIQHFSRYVTDGSSVFFKERMYPLVPRMHKVKHYKQFFMIDDTGMAVFLSMDDIQRYVQVPCLNIKTRGKTVLHTSSGKTFGSMKAACQAFNIKLSKLKSSADFIIT
jgi:hypothetical protein